MKKFISYCLPALLCLKVSGQPALLLPAKANYYNNKYLTAKDKYIILDFFATWCAPCIKALAHLDSMQRLFSNDLAVIVVTKEDRSTLKDFFSRHPELSSTTLQFIYGDSLLSRSFPHTQIPHEVILDRKGEFIAATYADAISADRLQLLLAAKTVRFPLKADRSLDASKPFSDQLTSDKMIRSQTTIADYIPGAGSMSGVKKDSVFARWYFINMPLIDLLQMASGRRPGAPHKINFSDSAKFIRRSDDPSVTGHLISYEISVPLSTPRTEMLAMMLSDLQSRFGIIAAVFNPPPGEHPSSVLMISKTQNQFSNRLHN